MVRSAGKLIQSVLMMMIALSDRCCVGVEFFFEKVLENKCLKGAHYTKLMTSTCAINFTFGNSKSFLRQRIIIRHYFEEARPKKDVIFC
jgi:hypothetical protein